MGAALCVFAGGILLFLYRLEHLKQNHSHLGGGALAERPGGEVIAPKRGNLAPPAYKRSGYDIS